MISQEQLRELCHDDTVVMTQHLTLRCDERGIIYNDIKATIQNGEIVEQYPMDYPYPSCLVLYRLEDGRFLHVVVGVGDSRLWIVTSYYPNGAEWKDDYKTRKEGV